MWWRRASGARLRMGELPGLCPRSEQRSAAPSSTALDLRGVGLDLCSGRGAKTQAKEQRGLPVHGRNRPASGAACTTWRPSGKLAFCFFGVFLNDER